MQSKNPKKTTTSSINLSHLNMSNAIDYKELTKTLAHYQQTKQGLDSPQKVILSPLKNKNLIDINFLKNAGILSKILYICLDL